VSNIVTLGVCFKKLHNIKVGAFSLILHQNLHYFRCPVLKDEKLIKSKPSEKLKHANLILEHFEYFCQISSNRSL